jgi:hypothetical protein
MRRDVQRLPPKYLSSSETWDKAISVTVEILFALCLL